MKVKKILQRVLVIALTLLMVPLVVSYALFQDRVVDENNTFSTSSVALKLFYDCMGAGKAQGLDEETYTSAVSGSLLAGEIGGVVECSSGTIVGGDERRALYYSDTLGGATYVPPGEAFNRELDGVNGNWTASNNWFDSLSSAFDHTNLTPGYKTYLGATPVFGEGNIMSIGNAGSNKLLDVVMTASYEPVDHEEAQEPLDGNLPGAKYIDPVTDNNWINTVGLAYETSLGSAIQVLIERVQPSEIVVEPVFSGSFDQLVARGPISIFPTTRVGLKANQVTYLRFNWSLDPNLDSSGQGKVFDYSIKFDSV